MFGDVKFWDNNLYKYVIKKSVFFVTIKKRVILFNKKYWFKKENNP
jgi:hypothetical protein